MGNREAWIRNLDLLRPASLVRQSASPPVRQATQARSRKSGGPFRQGWALTGDSIKIGRFVEGCLKPNVAQQSPNPRTSLYE